MQISYHENYSFTTELIMEVDFSPVLCSLEVPVLQAFQGIGHFPFIFLQALQMNFSFMRMEKKSKRKKKYPVNNRHKAREMMTISEWFAIIFLSYQIEKVKNLIWEKVCVENLQTGKNNSMSK